VFKLIELYITNTTVRDTWIFVDIKMNSSHLTPTMNRKNNRLRVYNKISGNRLDLDKSMLTETDDEPEVMKMVFINNRLQWTREYVENVNESVIASVLNFNKMGIVWYVLYGTYCTVRIVRYVLYGKYFTVRIVRYVLYGTYNLTLRRVRATIAAMEKQLVLHFLSVCL
jgi:hypothetical protein